MYCSKIKLYRLLYIPVETKLLLDKFKHKKGASISETFALFRLTSAGCDTVNNLFKANIIDIEQTAQVSGS